MAAYYLQGGIQLTKNSIYVKGTARPFGYICKKSIAMHTQDLTATIIAGRSRDW